MRPVVSGSLEPPVPDAGVAFVRGDANSDGTFDVADPMHVAFYLMEGGREPSCMRAADFDDSGWVDLSDAVAGLRSLFVPGAAQAAAPSNGCGVDSTPDLLGCQSYPRCN